MSLSDAKDALFSTTLYAGVIIFSLFYIFYSFYYTLGPFQYQDTQCRNENIFSYH
jgi:hypothetical protein